jgi:hypothetical protein
MTVGRIEQLTHDKTFRHHLRTGSNPMPNPGGWFRSTERLPEEGANVLTYNGVYENASVYVATFHESEFCDEDLQPLEGVTHWMPVPDPPKDSSEPYVSEASKVRDYKRRQERYVRDVIEMQKRLQESQNEPQLAAHYRKQIERLMPRLDDEHRKVAEERLDALPEPPA